MSVDLFVALLVIAGFWYGYTRGILRGLFAALVAVLGIFTAMWYTPVFDDFLREVLGLRFRWSAMAAFGSALLIFYLMFALFRKAIEEQVQTVKVPVANRFGSALLMAFFSVFLGSGLVKFADASGLLSEQTRQSSVSLSTVRRLPDLTYSALRNSVPIVKDFGEYVSKRLSGQDEGTPPLEPDPLPGTDN